MSRNSIWVNKAILGFLADGNTYDKAAITAGCARTIPPEYASGYYQTSQPNPPRRSIADQVRMGIGPTIKNRLHHLSISGYLDRFEIDGVRNYRITEKGRTRLSELVEGHHS